MGVFDHDDQIQVIQINPEHIGPKISHHIMFHVLGRYHEHQRPDRDQYIKVEWNNILKGNVR